MAEDQDFIEGGQQSTVKKKVYGGYKKPKCNIRIEELAKPKKWTMLATWREYRDTFDLDRMTALKAKIQEEFSMTPEETELYFSQLRKRAKRVQNKKALQKYINREKAAAKLEAYSIFRKLLMKAMRYAFKHPPPPIVSPMIRNISDKILEQLCELHAYEIPKRDCLDKDAQFLLNLSDWGAIIIGNIYYEVDVNEKVEQLMEVERDSRTSVSKTEDKEVEINAEAEDKNEVTESDIKTEDEIKSEPTDESPEEDYGG